MSDFQMNVLCEILGFLLWLSAAYIFRKKVYPRFLIWFSTSFSLVPFAILGLLEGVVFGLMKGGILFTLIYALLLKMDYDTGKDNLMASLDINNPDDLLIKFTLLNKVKVAFIIRIIIFSALSIFFSLEISKG